MTSEKMNHTMPQRNDVSTWLAYLPDMVSSITSPNHPISMISRMPAPMATRYGPTACLLSSRAKPPPSESSATAPTSGQIEEAGT